MEQNALNAQSSREEWLSRFCLPLLRWYERSARVLPWREEPTPYRVWVSEIMLQQTRVSAVLPYFERFLAALPDVASLAGADPEALSKLWEGLGYYSRVRNLQRAAQVIMEQYGGEFPRRYEQLRALPGIGDYTAGAVLSIAFNLPFPAVDGNVLRVLSRVCADKRDVTAPALKREWAGLLKTIYPEGRARDFTQALMELGAMVCLPNGEPQCLCCPVRESCEGFRLGLWSELPYKPPKAPRKIEARTVLLLRHEGRVLLHRRAPGGLLGGLWELPNFEGARTLSQLQASLEEYELAGCALSPLGEAKHIFTHLEWRMTGYLVTLPSPILLPQDYVWASLQEVEEVYALPGAFKMYRSLLPKLL